jgi:hypothetical protein
VSGASAASWGPLIGPTLGLIGALIGVGLTIRHNARTNRANLFSNYRLKWIDLFRDELTELLILGERLYELPIQPDERDEPEQKQTKRDLKASARRLLVLLGREDQLRVGFAEAVRTFASSPTAQLSELLEVEAQKVFRDAWNRVREDTGKPARAKPPLARPQGSGEASVPDRAPDGNGRLTDRASPG